MARIALTQDPGSLSRPRATRRDGGHYKGSERCDARTSLSGCNRGTRRSLSWGKSNGNGNIFQEFCGDVDAPKRYDSLASIGSYESKRTIGEGLDWFTKRVARLLISQQDSTKKYFEYSQLRAMPSSNSSNFLLPAHFFQFCSLFLDRKK
jgi:hypothetical protein